MKRLMFALAGAVALVGVASAGSAVSTWFSTGIKDYTTWEAVEEDDGAWSGTEGGEITGETGEKTIALDADAETPLSFTVNQGLEKTLGAETLALTVKSTIAFTPFAVAAVADMDVPEDAKGGVIVVKAADESLSYYVLAKKTDAMENEWVDTAIEASTDPTLVTISVAEDTAVEDVKKITYTFGEGVDAVSSSNYDIVISGAISSANYTGCGEIASLDATMTSPVYDLQFVSMPTGVDSVTVTVDEKRVDPDPVNNKYTIPSGKTAVIVYNLVNGYMSDKPSTSVTMSGDVTYSTDNFPIKVDKIIAMVGTTPYASLAAALTAVQENGTVTLMDNASLESTAKAMTIALGGKVLTIAGNTLSYNLAFTGDGSLVRTGDIAVNAVLDLSALQYEQIAGNTGKFVIGANAEVKLPVAQATRELIATGMFAGSVATAKVTTQTDYAIFDGDSWLVNNGKDPMQWIGDGSESNPYQIATKADMLLLRKYSKDKKFLDEGLCFKQMDDISLAGEAWDGIGPHVNSSKVGARPADEFFKGSYDGNNKKITDVAFALTNYQGFVNGLYKATVKNLEIDTVGITTIGYEKGNYGAGILTSLAAGSTIQNVTIGGEMLNATHNCAGFAIKAYDTTFTDCTNNAKITSEDKRVAGFVGFESSMDGMQIPSISFVRCVNNGDLKVGLGADSDDYGCGGFVGGLSNEHVSFVDCVSNGKVEIHTKPATEGDPEIALDYRAGSFIGTVMHSKTKNVTATGCSAKDANMKSIGHFQPNKSGAAAKISVSGLTFATVDATSGVASFTATPTLDGTEYKVMSTNMTDVVTLTAADQSLKLNTSLAEFAGTVTVSIDGYKTAPKVTTVGSVTTYEPEAQGGKVVPDEQGDAELKDGNIVITPKPGVTALTLNAPDGFEGKYEIPASITKVTAADGGATIGINNLIIKREGFEIQGACKLDLEGNILLDPEAKVKINDVEIPVTPTIGDGLVEEPFVVGETVSASVAAIPGLTYSLVRAGSLATDAAKTTVASEMAKTTSVTLTDASEVKPAAAFYVIEVSK